MTATVIDGKAFAAKVRAQVATHVARLKDENGITPGLAVVLVGEDPASKVYVKNKHASTIEVGMASFEHRLDAATGEAVFGRRTAAEVARLAHQFQRAAALANAGGALSRQVEGWREQLLDLRAEIEAQLDFSDEGDVGALAGEGHHDVAANAGTAACEHHMTAGLSTIRIQHPPSHQRPRLWRSSTAGGGGKADQRSGRFTSVEMASSTLTFVARRAGMIAASTPRTMAMTKI